MHELTTDAQIRELRAARLDLGIGLAPVDEPDLEFERLLREELVLAAPCGPSGGERRWRGRSARAGERELHHPAARNRSGPLRSDHQSLPLFGFAPRITQHARQMQTVIGLVSCGMGFALVPVVLAEPETHRRSLSATARQSRSGGNRHVCAGAMRTARCATSFTEVLRWAASCYVNSGGELPRLTAGRSQCITAVPTCTGDRRRWAGPNSVNSTSSDQSASVVAVIRSDAGRGGAD